MGTQRVQAEAKQTQDLIQQVQANTAPVEAAIQALAKELGMGPPPSISGLLQFFAQVAQQLSTAAVSKAQSHVAQDAGVSVPMNNRDQQVAMARAAVASYRRSLESYYGAKQVAGAFPSGGVPRPPDALAKYITQVATSLSALSPKWIAQPQPGTNVDPGAIVANLNKLATDLNLAINAVGASSSGAAATLTDRDHAWSRLHDSQQGLELITRGLMLLGGMRELEERLFISHHAHPAATPAPAPAAAAK